MLRAVEPQQGILQMRRRRGVEADRLLASGPGRLTAAFGMTSAENGMLMESSAVVLGEGEPVPGTLVLATPRIGITKAAELPLRFVIRDSVWLSRRGPRPGQTG